MTPQVLFTAAQIQTRVTELGQEISDYYASQIQSDQDKIFIVGVLKGAYMFAADLVRQITIPQQIEFVRLTSYGSGTSSSGLIKAPDLTLPGTLAGENILIVEDIVDTGQTAQFLINYLNDQFQPKSIKVASFLNKPSRRTVEIEPDFVGFEIEDKFVIGYGLDYAEKYRELDYLGYIE